MLPDLRIVIAAVISTFVLTAGVGFYASSRLIHEPKRTDSLAAMDETPVNRIALSWPAPTRQPEQPALDFAVTAKALRNPVRDITNDPATAWQAPQQSAAIATDRSDAASPASKPDRSIKIETLAPSAPVATPQMPVAPADVTPSPSSRTTTAPKPAPEPDIRIAVQYPPIAELPPELQAPVPAPVMVIPQVAPAPTAAVATQAAQDPVTTGSVVETPAPADIAPPDGTRPDSRVASRPEPEPAAAEKTTADVSPATKPAAKAARKKAAPKKAAPKAAKRPARVIRRQTVAPANTFPFNFFGTNLSN
jgi:hypothetical protein